MFTIKDRVTGVEAAYAAAVSIRPDSVPVAIENQAVHPDMVLHNLQMLVDYLKVLNLDFNALRYEYPLSMISNLSFGT